MREKNGRTAIATKHRIMLLILLFLLAITTTAFTEVLPVKVTGFGDFCHATRQDNTREDNFEIGQVEFDLETTIDENIIVGAAIAYAPGEETFGLGAFIVDFHLFGSEGYHFRPLSGIDLGNHGGTIRCSLRN